MTLKKQSTTLNLFLRKKKKLWKNSKNGYWYFYEDGRPKCLHREIALECVDGFQEGLDVNHIDGNKDNNHPSNLEWLSRSDNLKHSYKENGRKPYWKGKKGAEHKDSIPVKATCPLTGKTLTFQSLAETKQHGFSPSLVCRVLKGERNHHKGYMWNYLELVLEEYENEHV